MSVNQRIRDTSGGCRSRLQEPGRQWAQALRRTPRNDRTQQTNESRVQNQRNKCSSLPTRIAGAQEMDARPKTRMRETGMHRLRAPWMTTRSEQARSFDQSRVQKAHNSIRLCHLAESLESKRRTRITIGTGLDQRQSLVILWKRLEAKKRTRNTIGALLVQRQRLVSLRKSLNAKTQA